MELASGNVTAMQGYQPAGERSFLLICRQYPEVLGFLFMAMMVLVLNQLLSLYAMDDINPIEAPTPDIYVEEEGSNCDHALLELLHEHASLSAGFIQYLQL